jgi:predicted nucleic acid-binding protein
VSYLLDVNALVAWHHPGSPHHDAFHGWAKRVNVRKMATCGWVELGFLRVSMQVFRYRKEDAENALGVMKTAGLSFVSTAPEPVMAGWVEGPRQATDSYLLQIATASGMRLATFDAAIPKATLIARG